jgi:hypothetical protein
LFEQDSRFDKWNLCQCHAAMFPDYYRPEPKRVAAQQAPL